MHVRQLNVCKDVSYIVLSSSSCYVYVLFAIDLPTNFTLANLVEVVNLQEQATQSDDVKCGSCVKTGSSEVTAFCYNCKEFLCLNCTKSHKNMKKLQCHNRVSIEDLKSLKSPGGIEKPGFCRKHLEKSEAILCHLSVIDL